MYKPPHARTEVLITIDTEFSIAGALSQPDLSPVSAPVVTGAIKGKEHGLGFMLETFDRYNTKAVFFVEAINRCHFGLEEMGQYVERIKPHHDIQLHTHPVWAVYEGKRLQENPLFPQNDSLVGRSFEQVSAVLDIGKSAFADWGLDAPIAIRTGSLMVEPELYPCFAKAGFKWSSSVGVGIYPPNDIRLHLEHNEAIISGVTELPVTTFADFPASRKGHRKTLQVTSCSWPETQAVLEDAHRKGVKRVVILTHPFEYFKRKDFRYSKLQPNRINQNRLAHLCRFLDENQDRFYSTDFVSMDTAPTEPVHTSLRSKHDGQALIRAAHNKLNDTLWSY
jgi:hypothetical protein